MDNFPDHYEEILRVDEIICPSKYTVHFLFLKEKREFFLMLGRSDTPVSRGSSDNSSYSSSNGDSFDSSNDNSLEEVDDDSPYFVKITLDQTFLTYLEDSEVYSGPDVPNNYERVLDNKFFKEIVKSEFEIMFGGDSKKKVCDGHHHDESDNLLENKSLSAESNSLNSSNESKSKKPPSAIKQSALNKINEKKEDETLSPANNKD